MEPEEFEDEGDQFVLTAPRFRDVDKELTPRGEIFHNTKRYWKGDSLTGLSREKIDRLVGLGAAESKQTAAEREAATLAAEYEAAQAALDTDEDETGEKAIDPSEPQGEPEEPSEEDVEEQAAEDEEFVPTDFASWDYPDLQQAAKERVQDGSGNKQALIDRLAAHELAAHVASDQ